MVKSRSIQHLQAYEKGMAAKGSFNTAVDNVARYFAPTYDTLNIDPQNSELAMPNTSAGILAQNRLVAGLYSNTVSMGKGVLTSADPRLKDLEEATRFYGMVGEKTNDVVMTIMPNKYLEMLPRYCLSSVGIGFVEFDKDTGEHNLLIYDQRNCVWEEDARGNVVKMRRGFEFTADQAVDEFGLENVGNEIQEAYHDESKSSEKFEFIHVVCKRKKRNKDRMDSMNMPYEELYIEKKSRKIVKEWGYKRFRYVVVVMNRIDGRPTGYSPPMFSLPSVRSLVRGTDIYYDAVEMATFPTLFLSDRDAVEDAENELAAGKIHYARLDQGAPFTYGGQTDPSGIMEANKTLREEINSLHFLELFQALEDFKTGTRTAYEVAQIIAEKIHLIAPVVHPLKNKWFAPIFEIVSQDIMDPENGLIDEPIPDVLQGDEYRVEYTSRIDVQMNGVETENLLYALTEAATAAETLNKGGFETQALVILEEVQRAIFEARHIDPKLYRDSDGMKNELKGMIQAHQAAQAREAQLNAASKTDLMKRPEEGSPASIIQSAQRDVAV